MNISKTNIKNENFSDLLSPEGILMDKKSHGNASFVERREDVHLQNSVFGQECLDELREIDKHEIIMKICEILGSQPSNIGVAEQIFEKIKFDITRFIMHHEYCRENTIRRRLLIWLDTKVNPANEVILTSFIDKYFK
jgi:hypothetical protein